MAFDREAVLQARIEELEAIVRRQAEMLAPTANWLFLGLRPHESDILRVLYAASPQPVSLDRVIVALGSDITHATLRKQVFQLRHWLARHGVSIETAWSVGYVLSTDAKRRLDALRAEHEAAQHDEAA